MNNIPASRKVATAHLLGWQVENLYKEMNLKERKSEEILLEKKEDGKSGHIKMISAFALLLTSSLLQICC